MLTVIFKLNQMKQITIFCIGWLLVSILIIACKKVDLKKDVPNCIEIKIQKIANKAVQNPPAKIWEWQVNGQRFYYFTSDCCDQYNYLYDDNCNIVCAPDGGFTGGGDGRCPQFNGQIEKILVWEDDRK